MSKKVELSAEERAQLVLRMMSKEEPAVQIARRAGIAEQTLYTGVMRSRPLSALRTQLDRCLRCTIDGTQDLGNNTWIRAQLVVLSTTIAIRRDVRFC